METITYSFKNAPVPGGGFVTGLLFSDTEEVLYARTDVGGAYRYDFKTDNWISLMDNVSGISPAQSSPLSIAVCGRDFYMACGCVRENAIAVSHDYGNNFEEMPLDIPVNGNSRGRGTGERLLVNGSEMLFGSQGNGLMRSFDGGMSWEKINVNNELEITFLWKMNDIVIAGTSGENNAVGNKRGHSVYVSYDNCESFEKLEYELNSNDDECSLRGFVGSHCSFDGKYLYITFAETGKFKDAKFSMYSCDCGSIGHGAVLRFELVDGVLMNCTDVTPENYQEFRGGFSGVSAEHGVIVVSSVCSYGNPIFLSEDCGKTWKKVMHGLEIGRFDWNVPYMKPEYNNNGNLAHWINDIKINPYNKNQAFFTTGTGIFKTDNLLDESVLWQPCCKGIEETVHLNVYSPPDGKVKLIDIVGDLGGFAFENLDEPCENSFADENGNRYITCMNADYCDTNTDYVVAAARGNWAGITKGGLILSHDNCKSWKRLNMPYGISSEIDELLAKIEKPNVNPGWAAVSADSKAIVWAVGERNSLPINAVCVTFDEGISWEKVRVFDMNNAEITDRNLLFKPFSDRVKPEFFYGFGENGQVYLSNDYGKSFYEINSSLPKVNMGQIDGSNRTEIRAECEKDGVLWIAAGADGLWKMKVNMAEKSAEYTCVSRELTFAQGMGKAAENSPFHTLYICGIIGGVYGFFRSHDEGKSWKKVGNDRQLYGRIRSICGDMREYGRFYIATGGRGVIYAEQC